MSQMARAVSLLPVMMPSSAPSATMYFAQFMFT